MEQHGAEELHVAAGLAIQLTYALIFKRSLAEITLLNCINSMKLPQLQSDSG
jgi:hypothetical protein